MIAIQPRKTILKLEYNDTDISGDISGDVESFTYNDRGADSSDSISIKVNAVDDKWINSWLPDKEAVLHPTLCTCRVTAPRLTAGRWWWTISAIPLGRVC